MSSTGNPSMYVRKVAHLWTALGVALFALVAMLAFTVTPVTAQQEVLSVTKLPDPLVNNPPFADGNKVEVLQGDTVTFTIRVANTPADGTGDIIVDQVLDACTTGPTRVLPDITGNGDNVLNDGDVWRYRCVVKPVQTSFTNNAEVRAHVQATNLPLSDSDAAEVKVLNRLIHVEKDVLSPPTPNPVLMGDNVTFLITVRNTGLQPIHENTLTISDPNCSVINPGSPLPTRVLPSGFVLGDANGNNMIDPDDGNPANGINGEVWEYNCVWPNVLDNFVNTVQVKGKDTTGREVTHSASKAVTVLNPGLAITKKPNKPVVKVGENVQWTMEVYNTGEVAYRNLTLVDADCTAAGGTISGPLKTITINTDDILDPGEMWKYFCAIPAGYPTPGTKYNNATISGTRNIPVGGTDSDSVLASIEVIVPGLAIEKVPFIQYVYQGDDALFQLHVTNTGQREIATVRVFDPLCAELTGPLPGSDLDGDQKIDPDDGTILNGYQGETWKYQCRIPQVQNDFANVAWATGIDGANNPIETTKITAFIYVIKPSINIEKTLDPATSPIYRLTDPRFFLKVTNKGNIELRNVAVTDLKCDTLVVPEPALTIDGDNDGQLDPGDEFVYSCRKLDIVADFTNIAYATAIDPNNKPVNDEAELYVNVLNPDLLLEKEPRNGEVVVGNDVIWTLTVKNTGEAPLTPVAGLPAAIPSGNSGIVDPLCLVSFVPVAPFDTTTLGVLSPGESWSFTCNAGSAITFSQDEIVNTAIATFRDPVLNQVSDIETARIKVRGEKIDVRKFASPNPVVYGQNVAFSFEVRNFTGAEITSVALTDSYCAAPPVRRAGSDADNDNKLDTNEIWYYDCTVVNVIADFTNNAIVTGVDSNGVAVSDNDRVDIKVINAKLDVDKSTDTPVVSQGSNVLFNIVIKNTGNEVLKEIGVTDLQCPGADLVGPTGDIGNDQRMAPNEVWSYTCTVKNVQQNFTNTVLVTAKEPAGQALSRNDSADVQVLRAGINLQKIAGTSTVQQGGTALFTILVSNEGSTNLTNVIPVDAQCTSLVEISKGNGDAILTVGETWVYNCLVNNVQGTNGTYTNTASVTATGTNGAQVNSTDSASVTVIGLPTPTPTPVTPTATPVTPTPTPVTPTVTPVPPTPTATSVPTGKLKLQKSPATQTIVKGATATFQVTLNNGTVEDLTGVVLSDPQCTTLTRDTDGSGNNDNTLNKGDTWRWTCTIVNVQKSFTNKAKATAIRPGGKKLTASASAKVKVVNSSQLSIETSVNDAAVNAGASLPMRVTVTNIGAGNLRDLQVSHNACTDALVYVGGDVNGDNVLNRGESWAYTCTIANIQGDVNGLATAAAIDDSDVVQEADALTDVTVITDEENEEAAPAFKIFTPLIIR